MKKKLKIAIFCTNEYPTPPRGKSIYAPLWVTWWITEGIVKKGHKVYLFGSSDSKTKANLVSEGLVALKNNKKVLNKIKNYGESVLMYENILVSKLYQMAQKNYFDLVHVHPYKRVLHVASLIKIPTLITIHEPLDDPVRKLIFNYYKKYPQLYFVSISNSQRKPIPNINYIATIYNGIEIEKYKFNKKPKNYFLIAGRINEDKGVHIACEIAKRTGIFLKIAGLPDDKEYFQKKVVPYLKYKNISYLGTVPYNKMPSLFKYAKGFLFPIQWEEPFGLVMVEAMACGTPVIAFNRGSVPEVVKHGKTGFVVNNIKEAVEAIKKIDTINREDCRKWVEEKFTVERMVDEYEKVYYKIFKK